MEVNDNFWAEGAGDYAEVLRDKFKWKRKVLEDKLGQVTSPEEEQQLQADLEQLEREHKGKLGQIDDSLF